MFGDKLIKHMRMVRDGRPVAVVFDPFTGTPDFEGYRPRESELPQQQPVAEVIQHEVSGESADEMLARVIAAHEIRHKVTEEEDNGSI